MLFIHFIHIHTFSWILLNGPSVNFNAFPYLISTCHCITDWPTFHSIVHHNCFWWETAFRTCGPWCRWRRVLLGISGSQQDTARGRLHLFKNCNSNFLIPLKKLYFVKAMIKSFETPAKGYQKCHAIRIVCQSVFDFDFIHQFDHCTACVLVLLVIAARVVAT